MKIKFTFFLCLLLSSNLIHAQTADCSRTTNFGATEICLPSIEGYQECYLQPLIKQMADRTEVASNQVLGFYLNHETREHIDSLVDEGINDYFKFYATKQLKDQKVDTNMLNEMRTTVSGNFIEKNWEELAKELDYLKVTVNTPTIVKSYKANSHSFSCVIIANYQMETGENTPLVMSINGIVVKEKLIWMAYYFRYENEKTVDQVVEKTNLIITELLKYQ